MVNFLFIQEISFSPETVLQKQIVMKGYGLKILIVLINSIIPNASFLNLLKTSRNRTVFWCFQGEEKGCIWNE